MRSLLSLLLVLLIGLTGCQDDTLTDGATAGVAAAPPAALKAGPPSPNCPSNPSVSIAGPGNVVPGRSGVYSASIDSRCTVSFVRWSVSPSSAGTLVTSGNSVTVTPTANFTLRAEVIYDVDNIAIGTKSVTVGPENIVVQISSVGGFFRIGWPIPAGTATVSLTRFTKDNFGNTTGPLAIGSGGPEFCVFTDNVYIIVPNGPLNVTYSVTIRDSAGIVIAQGSNSARGDTAI